MVSKTRNHGLSDGVSGTDGRRHSVWKYPQGNQQAHDEAKMAAEGYNSGEQHILLVPVPVGETGQYGVEIIDPGFQGVETLHQLLTQYFGHRIKRYILGQVLSSESEATGMGSGVADLHADTLLQILQSDSANLEETLTSDLLGSIIQINVQKGIWAEPGFRPRFAIQTEQADIDKQLQAWTSLLDRGLSFRKRDLYQLVGAAIPGPGDDVLDPKAEKAQKDGPHGTPSSVERASSPSLLAASKGSPKQNNEIKSQNQGVGLEAQPTKNGLKFSSGVTGGGFEPPVPSKSQSAPTIPSAQHNTNADQRRNRSLTRQS